MATTTRSAAGRIGRVALLLALGACERNCGRAVITAGDAAEYEEKADSLEKVFCPVNAGSKRSLDHYAAVRGKPGVQDAGVLTRLPGELWGPFRVEATIGALGFSTDAAVRKAEAGLEVDVRGSEPLAWWAVRASRTE